MLAPPLVRGATARPPMVLRGEGVALLHLVLFLVGHLERCRHFGQRPRVPGWPQFLAAPLRPRCEIAPKVNDYTRGRFLYHTGGGGGFTMWTSH